MMTVKKYLLNRLCSLRPAGGEIANPFRLFGKLSAKQWRYFFLGWLAWSWDSFDFHSVTLSYSDLMTAFDKNLEELTLAVTLTLMTRPIGGAVFGILADRYGRKWPFIVNCGLLIIFVLATGFCKTYGQFVAIRTLFGCAMGGIYGNAAATALEDCPEESRGLMSGIYQSGYPLGYILAVVFYKAFHSTPYHWRALFWFGSAVPVLLIVFRLCLDETDTWKGRKRLGNQHTRMRGVGGEVMLAIRRHWLLLFYLVFLLMGMMYLSHGTQDIYPYLLRYKYRNIGSTDEVISKITTIQTVASVGGVVGGVTVGYSSQVLGRRLSIIVVCIIGGALLYPYTFTTGYGIHAAAFFEQFCVQGSWSVIPIHLIELSPPAFRTFIVGTSYQTGSLVASASNTIIAKIATCYPVPTTVQGGVVTQNYDFRIPITMFVACAFAYVILMAAVGPEKLGREMLEDDGDETDDFGIQGEAIDMARIK